MNTETDTTSMPALGNATTGFAIGAAPLVLCRLG